MGGCCHNETIHIQIEDDFVDPFIFEQTDVAGTDFLFPVASILPYLQVFELAYTPFNQAESPPTLTASTKLALLQSYRC